MTKIWNRYSTKRVLAAPGSGAFFYCYIIIPPPPLFFDWGISRFLILGRNETDPCLLLLCLRPRQSLPGSCLNTLSIAPRNGNELMAMDFDYHLVKGNLIFAISRPTENPLHLININISFPVKKIHAYSFAASGINPSIVSFGILG